MKKILVVDICDTLYDSNTTFDFLDFYFYKNKKYIKLNILRKNIFIKIFNKIFYKLSKKDLIRIIFTKLLKCEINLENQVEEFYNVFLKTKENKKVLDLVQEYKNKRYKIIIISGTYDFIAKKIAQKLKVEDVYGTVLEMKNGKYTGKISRDILLEKELILKKLIEDLKPKSIDLLTDNITDYPLVKYMTKVNIVLTSRNKNFWNSKKSIKINLLKEK